MSAHRSLYVSFISSSTSLFLCPTIYFIIISSERFLKILLKYCPFVSPQDFLDIFRPNRHWGPALPKHRRLMSRYLRSDQFTVDPYSEDATLEAGPFKVGPTVGHASKDDMSSLYILVYYQTSRYRHKCTIIFFLLKWNIRLHLRCRPSMGYSSSYKIHMMSLGYRYFQLSLKYLKKQFLTNCMLISKTINYTVKINMDLEETTLQNMQPSNSLTELYSTWTKAKFLSAFL